MEFLQKCMEIQCFPVQKPLPEFSQYYRKKKLKLFITSFHAVITYGLLVFPSPFPLSKMKTDSKAVSKTFLLAQTA